MSKLPVFAVTSVACLLLASAARAQSYVQTDLVSDGTVPALQIDANLKDPWGMSYSANSPIWVSDQASNFQNVSTGNSSAAATLVSVASATGATSVPGLIVNIPNLGNAAADPNANGPTGQVSTGAPGIATISTDFLVTGPNGGTPHEASFAFANLDGSISAWAGGNSGTPIANTTATIEASVAGASFTGLAIANNPLAAIGGASGAEIFAADQNSGNVYIFNSSWAQIGMLTDPHGLPAGYTAFNVQNIGGILFVTFANQNNTLGGIVDEFSPNGTFITRLIDDSNATTPHGNLDQPWGMAIAPSNWGQFSGDLLVGNNGGDNWINAFNPTTGAFVGSLEVNGHFFHEGNLWALTFGNGASGGNPNVLYFDAGLNAAGTEGLFGAISLSPEPPTSLLLALGGAIIAVARVARRKPRGTANTDESSRA